FLPGLLAGLL
uniref:Temporin-1Re n=2 Tax=Ranoidea TaxID=30352 RepID=TP1E_PELRI|nr:RecName: Full=Temporin-ECa [Euphlyctis cyanophlyctis]C0HL06.1 RecName: Full=Temporin-1Re [Pelophylax ridibundus]